MDIKTVQKRLRDAYVPEAVNDNKIASTSQENQLRLITSTGEHLVHTLTESGYQLVNSGFSMRLVQRIS
jgi:hypothetical protein